MKMKKSYVVLCKYLYKNLIFSGEKANRRNDNMVINMRLLKLQKYFGKK